MQWIKASERLPSNGKDNNLKIDGLPFSGRYWDADAAPVTKIAYKHFNVAGKTILDSSAFDRIFWLDESTPTVPGSVGELRKERTQILKDMETLANMQSEAMGWVVEKAKRIKELEKENKELQLAVDIRDSMLSTAGLSHAKLDKEQKKSIAEDICKLKTPTSQPSSPVVEDVIEDLLSDFVFDDGQYTFSKVEVKALMQLAAGHAYKGQQGESASLNDTIKLCEDYLDQLRATNESENETVLEVFIQDLITSLKKVTSSSIPLSIVEELEKANPWKLDVSGAFGYRKDGWNKCLSKLRELLQQDFPKVIQPDFDTVWQWLMDFALSYHKSNNKDIANDASEWLTDRWKELLQSQPTCAKNAQVQNGLPEVYLALKELVDLKEIKEWLGEYPEDCTPEEREKRLEDYATRKPIAWEKAKKVIENFQSQPAAPIPKTLIEVFDHLCKRVQELFDEKKNNPKNKKSGLSEAWNNVALSLYNAKNILQNHFPPTQTDKEVKP